MSDQAWARAREVRDKLAVRLLGHPDVSLVDVGKHETSDELVVRVHVRTGTSPPAGIPTKLDGIPVQVVRGDYHLQGEP